MYILDYLVFVGRSKKGNNGKGPGHFYYNAPTAYCSKS